MSQASAPGQEIVLTSKSVAISDVLDTLRARGAHVTILILDACRDNPFKDKDTRGIGGKRGLAPFAGPVRHVHPLFRRHRPVGK